MYIKDKNSEQFSSYVWSRLTTMTPRLFPQINFSVFGKPSVLADLGALGMSPLSGLNFLHFHAVLVGEIWLKDRLAPHPPS